MTAQPSSGTFRMMMTRDSDRPQPIGVPLHDVAVSLDDLDAPIVQAREDGGLCVTNRHDFGPPRTSTLLWAMICRRSIIQPIAGSLTQLAARELVLPWSSRWNEAISTALIGPWCDPLLTQGHLPATALGALRAEARTLHRQLVPIWRRSHPPRPCSLTRCRPRRRPVPV